MKNGKMITTNEFLLNMNENINKQAFEKLRTIFIELHADNYLSELQELKNENT